MSGVVVGGGLVAMSFLLLRPGLSVKGTAVFSGATVAMRETTGLVGGGGGTPGVHPTATPVRLGAFNGSVGAGPTPRFTSAPGTTRTKGVVGPRRVTAGISGPVAQATSPIGRYILSVCRPGVSVRPVPELGMGGT